MAGDMNFCTLRGKNNRYKSLKKTAIRYILGQYPIEDSCFVTTVNSAGYAVMALVAKKGI